MKIVFDHVAKSYGMITALKDVSFSVSDGEFVFLTGPSGAGKSTILKLLLSQTTPTGGTISLGGCPLSTATRSQINRLRCQIGVIFQDYQLIFDKTLEENIALALDIVGYAKSSVPSRIDAVLSQTHLSSRRHLFPSQLSGGELQRAALARALSIEPRLILADEPTGNLDPENSWNLLKLLHEINHESHTTILMTTHNYDFINSLDHRIIHISQGEIVPETQETIVEPSVIPPTVKKKIRRKRIIHHQDP